MLHSPGIQTTIRLILASAGAACLLLLAVISGHSFASGGPYGTLPALIPLTFQWLAVAAGLAAITCNLVLPRSKSFYLATAVLSFAFSAIWFSILIAPFKLYSQDFIYGVQGTALLLETSCGVFLLGHLVNTANQEFRLKSAFGVLVSMFGLSLFISLLRGSMPGDTTLLSLSLLKNSLWVAAPFWFVYWEKALPKSMSQALPWHQIVKTRLKTDQPWIFWPTAIFWGGAVINTITCSVFLDRASEINHWSLAFCHWEWLGLLGIGVAGLLVAEKIQHQGLVRESLISQAAKTFIGKHYLSRKAWAATSGTKSALFYLHHDPQGELQSHVPQTILQIRSEEIQRCMRDVLADQQLYLQNFAGSISTAIDAEQSPQPMVTALCSLASMYLDAGPLIERRLGRLASLLPIIDPGLSAALHQADATKLVDRGQWFFFVDYSWIDQSLMHTPVSQNYSVRLANQTDFSRLELMAKMASETIGNLLWLSAPARERLLLEAPFLAPIIESQPLTPHNSQDEELFFTIKFEQLVPRLQRYCNLDEYRESLLHYRPLSDNLKLLSAIDKQVEKLSNIDGLVGLVETLTSFPWHGFREKDQALAIITKVYNRADEISRQEPEENFEKFHSTIVQAIEAIGYPNQVLHDAHRRKREIRNIEVIREVLLNPNNPRFTEVWLLLSCGEDTDLTISHRHEIAEYICRLPDKIFQLHPMVLHKAIDYLILCCRTSFSSQGGTDPLTILEDFCRKVLHLGCDPIILGRLLDGFEYLSRFDNGAVELPTDGLRFELEQAVRQLVSSGALDPQSTVALESRWKNFTNRRSGQNAA